MVEIGIVAVLLYTNIFRKNSNAIATLFLLRFIVLKQTIKIHRTNYFLKHFNEYRDKKDVALIASCINNERMRRKYYLLSNITLDLVFD